MSSAPIPFGIHLMLDFYGCPEAPLSDMEGCYNALNNLPKVLNMHILTPPFVVRAPSTEGNGGKDPGGFSGFIVIAESHISVHTFPKRGFVSIDVYSCKQFDTVKATKYFETIFRPKEKEENIVNRGSFYPPKNIY